MIDSGIYHRLEEEKAARITRERTSVSDKEEATARMASLSGG